MASNIPDDFQAGATSFVTVAHGNNKFAVVKGKTLDDLKYVFKVKFHDGKFFFINMASKAKSWELPDCYPNDRSLSADQAASSNNNNNQQAAPSAEAAGGDASQQQDAATANNASPASPTVSSTMDPADRALYVDRVRAIYLKYNPSKLSDLDKIIGQFEGKFDALIESLVKRYSAEPSEEERKMLLANAVSAGGVADAASPLTAADAAASPGPPRNNNNTNSSAFDNKEPGSPGLNITGSPDQQQASSPSAGGEWTYRDRVYAIYNKYNPEKSKHAEKQLRTYAGQEQLLINALVNKYGPEPPRPPPQSSPGSPSLGNTASNNNADASPLGQQQQEQGNNTSSQQQQQQSSDNTSEEQQKNNSDNNNNEYMMTNNNNNAGSSSLSPTGREMATHATETDPAPLPVPRAPVVTVDLPQAPPESPSPIFDTQKLLQAPASVRQELLMSFLQDRDARLKEALDRNERYSQVIQQLQDGHDNLSRECEMIKRRAMQDQDTLRSQLRDAQHGQEMTKSKWEEERERSASKQELDKLEAQRNIHSQLIALEETKIQYGKEISDLKSKLSVSSHSSKAVREEATALLSVLARKEEQLRSQQEELNKLQVKIQGPVKVAASVQTQESLSDIIRSVAKHISGQQNSNSPRSASAEAESFKNISARLAQANHDRSVPLPVADPHSCKRCNRAPGVLACRTCRLTLCYHCDDTVHSNNIRFRAHQRALVAIDGRENAAHSSGARGSGGSRSISAQQQNGNNNSPSSQDRHLDATLGLLPGDIDEQLASGMDAEVFDRIISQFDVAYAEKRNSKSDEVDRLRNHVRELEENIAKLRREGSTGGSNNANNNLSTTSVGGMSPISPSAGGRAKNGGGVTKEQHHLANVQLQIEVEQRRNAELCSRIQELEAMLLASPENKEFEETGRASGGGSGFGLEEKRQLELHVNQLQQELDGSRNEVKEKRREIAEMRSLLSAHMSSPASSRKRSGSGMMTPNQDKPKPMYF